MRRIIFILITLILFSCKKNDDSKSNIQENVEIKILLGSGSLICDEFCGSTIDIVDGESNLKLKSNLPDSITNKFEFWNRAYIATVEFTEERCNCKDGNVEPKPNEQYPTNTLKIVDILKIREK